MIPDIDAIAEELSFAINCLCEWGNEDSDRGKWARDKARMAQKMYYEYKQAVGGNE